MTWIKATTGKFISRTTGLRVRQGIMIFAFLLLVVLTLKAILDPLISFDSYIYHLPFSRSIWHIGNYTPTDLPAPYYPLWLGFPKFAEVMQGCFWYLTGLQSTITVPHVILFACYVRIIHRYLRLPQLLLILALFACPMLMIHYIDSYIDLFCGLNLAIAFFGFTHAIWQLSRPACVTWGYDIGWAAIAIVMASNSKFLAYFPAMILLALMAWQVFFNTRLIQALKLKFLALLGVIAICCSIVPIANTIYFHNPFYPITAEINHHKLFNGTMTQYTAQPEYSQPILNYPPVRSLLSASEIDWAFRGVRTAYSNDSGFADHPAYGPPARTGGWGGMYFLIMLVMLGSALLKGRKTPDTFLKKCLSNFFIFAFMCSYLPNSFELRYFLYIPLIMIPLALKLCFVDRSTLRCAKAFLVVAIMFNFPHFDFEAFHLGLVNHHFESK